LGTELSLFTNYISKKADTQAGLHVLDVVAVDCGVYIAHGRTSYEAVDGSDVCDHDIYTARKNQEQRNDAERANGVQTVEEIWLK